MDTKTKNQILKQGYLFRGTSDKLFQLFRNSQSDYVGCSDRTQTPIIHRTSTSLRVMHAMISGQHRIKQDYQNTISILTGSRPILLGISVRNYLNNLIEGDEFDGIDSEYLAELVITKPIAFDDITIIDSLDIFEKVCEKEFKFLRDLQEQYHKSSDFNLVELSREFFIRYYLKDNSATHH